MRSLNRSAATPRMRASPSRIASTRAREWLGRPRRRHAAALALELRRIDVPEPVDQELLRLADVHTPAALVEQPGGCGPVSGPNRTPSGVPP